jgi:hypothetical protein
MVARSQQAVSAPFLFLTQLCLSKNILNENTSIFYHFQNILAG